MLVSGPDARGASTQRTLLREIRLLAHSHGLSLLLPLLVLQLRPRLLLLNCLQLVLQYVLRLLQLLQIVEILDLNRTIFLPLLPYQLVFRFLDL